MTESENVTYQQMKSLWDSTTQLPALMSCRHWLGALKHLCSPVRELSAAWMSDKQTITGRWLTSAREGWLTQEIAEAILFPR